MKKMPFQKIVGQVDERIATGSALHSMENGVMLYFH